MLQSLFTPDVLRQLQHKLECTELPAAGERALGQPGVAMRLEYRQLTVLHVESPHLLERAPAARFREEFEWLCDCNLGQLEPGQRGTAVAVFQQPQAALLTAIALQRACGDLRLRIGLASGRCVVAVFEDDTQWPAIATGPSLEQAATCAGQASEGSILVEPDTYRKLDAAIIEHAGECVLTEEFYGSELARVSITPAPAPSAELSSFAGLGLL
jgi:hypothetical protein